LPIVFAALLFTLVGPVQEAYAAFLTLNDSVEDQITISGSQFEFGTTGTGTVVGETATFTGGWFVNDANTNPGNGIIFFTDSDGDVSDIITATWSTVVQLGFDRSTITITVQSSPNCENLGALPAGFTGIPESPRTFLNTLFVDTTSKTQIFIPSNLNILFLASEDINCDPDAQVSNFYWSEDDGTGEIFTADRATQTITQLTSQPGVLFGTDARGGNLILINQNTGVSNIVGSIGILVPSLALDPTTGIMYAGGGGGNSNIFTVNTGTGQAIFVGFSGLGFASIGGMDFRSF